MGIESFGEKTKQSSFEQDFEELIEREKEVKQKVKLIFQGNAELNAELLSEKDLNFSERQKRYYGDQLKKIREEIKNVLRELRGTTNYEIPEELRGVKAADNYYRKIREAV